MVLLLSQSLLFVMSRELPPIALMQQMMAMGFNEQQCNLALFKHDNQVNRAVEWSAAEHV